MKTEAYPITCCIKCPVTVLLPIVPSCFVSSLNKNPTCILGCAERLPMAITGLLEAPWKHAHKHSSATAMRCCAPPNYINNTSRNPQPPRALLTIQACTAHIFFCLKKERGAKEGVVSCSPLQMKGLFGEALKKGRVSNLIERHT